MYAYKHTHSLFSFPLLTPPYAGRINPLVLPPRLLSCRRRGVAFLFDIPCPVITFLCVVVVSQILTVHNARLVLDTLRPLPGDRKCFRMINGVLVERTVKDVVPALETNSEGLAKVLDDLIKQYKAKQDEMESWKVSILYSLRLLFIESCCAMSITGEYGGSTR